jgi:hypothetical protein
VSGNFGKEQVIGVTLPAVGSHSTDAKWPVGRSRPGGLLGCSGNHCGNSKSPGSALPAYVGNNRRASDVPAARTIIQATKKIKSKNSKSKGHRLPSEADDDVISRLAGSRKSEPQLAGASRQLREPV